MDSNDLGCENISGCDNTVVTVRETTSGLNASNFQTRMNLKTKTAPLHSRLRR